MTKRVIVNDRRIIHKGRVFDITVENVTFFNGFTADLEVIRHPGASAIVPLTDDNRIIMLKQYRHAIGEYMWEIPAGTFDGQEEPLRCAQRELTEETGFEANTWRHLGAITPVPGYSDEKIELFMAQGLSPAAQNLDEDEFLEVHPLPFQHVVKMITSGEIQDAKTITGVFLAMELMQKKAK